MTDVKNLENFFDRNVSYATAKSKIYDRLRDDPLSPFQGRTMADIFVYAAVSGFKYGRREALQKAKPYISAVAFSRTQIAILLTIVIAGTHSIDILFKSKDATKILEEYANVGIERLEVELLGSVRTDAITRMSSMMKEIISERAKGQTQP